MLPNLRTTSGAPAGRDSIGQGESGGNASGRRHPPWLRYGSENPSPLAAAAVSRLLPTLFSSAFGRHLGLRKLGGQVIDDLDDARRAVPCHPKWGRSIENAETCGSPVFGF
eukprot:evm.model.scf_2405.4 EVM.evm.TU.scf_2405.4   scf_2405:22417-22749(-)